MTPQSCPDPEKLRSFVRCSVSEQESQSISEHLEQCPTCDETVVGLERDSDTIAERIKRAAAQPSFSHEPECQKILESLLDRALPAVEDLSAGDAPLLAVESLRDYRIVAKLGEGGMGTVYKAVHQRLKKTVALKVLPTRRIGDEPALARFAREMEVLGQLNHPHIVQALDAGEHDGQHYLVMEYVEGWDLAELVKRRGPLPIADACELISQAALGLQYAHENGFVHRDIKPSNLMLARPDSRTRTAAPTVKILDLGLARVLDQQAEAAGTKEELTSTGQVMGTLDYMAPEQGGDAHQVDIRADIYSLGATFYKLLTGDSPFAEYAKCPPLQRLLAIAQNDPPAIRTKRADVPEELAAIIHRMLAKNPAERFGTPTDVVTALAPFATEADLSALWNVSGGKSLGEANLMPSPSRLVSTREASRFPSQERIAAQATSLGSGGRSRWRWPLIAAAGFLALVALGVILSIRTPQGEIVVELGEGVAAESVKIEVSGHGTTKIADQKSGWTIDVKEGKHHVTLTGASQDQLQIDQNTVEVTRNKAVRVKVTLKPPAIANASPSPSDQPASSSAGGSSIEPTTPQAAKPIRWQPGPTAALVDGLATQPASLPGVRRWQVMPVEPMDDLYSVAWHPTQDLIAAHTGSREGVRVYGVRGDQFRLETVFPAKEAFVDWSPDGVHLALASAKDQITVWNYADGHPVCMLESNAAGNRHCFTWSADSRHAAVLGLKGGVEIWDALAGKKLRVLEDKQQAKSLAWSPDGKWLAVGRGDNSIQLWNMAKEQVGPILDGHANPPTSLAWSPDSQWLASQANGTTIVNVWGVDGKLFKSQDSEHRGTQILSWRPDGKELFLKGWNYCGMTWNVFGSDPPVNLQNAINFFSAGAFSPRSERLLTWRNNSITLFEQRDGKWKPLKPFGGSTNIHITASASGNSFASLDYFGDNVVAWQPGHWQAYRVVSKYRLAASNRDIRHALTSDGRFLAANHHESASSIPPTLVILDLKQGTVYREIPLDSAKAFSWSPNDKSLATGSEDGILRLWDISSGKVQHVLTGHKESIRTVFWSPDGKRIVSQSGDQSIWLWDPVTGSAVAEIEQTANREFVTRVAWYVEAQRLAMTNGNQVLLANAATGEKIDTIDYKTAIRDVHWIDANHLVIVQANDPRSAQCRMACWNLTDKRFTWDETFSVPVSPETNHVWTELSPDGKSLAIFCLEPMVINLKSGKVTGRPKSFEEISWPLDHRHRFAPINRGRLSQRYIHHLDMTGSIDWRGAVLANSVPVYVSAAGEVMNPGPQVEEQLRYVLELESGEVVTLAPAEFRRQFEAKTP